MRLPDIDPPRLPADAVLVIFAGLALQTGLVEFHLAPAGWRLSPP
jgi:hypothetical protein